MRENDCHIQIHTVTDRMNFLFPLALHMAALAGAAILFGPALTAVALSYSSYKYYGVPERKAKEWGESFPATEKEALPQEMKNLPETIEVFSGKLNMREAPALHCLQQTAEGAGTDDECRRDIYRSLFGAAPHASVLGKSIIVNRMNESGLTAGEYDALIGHELGHIAAGHRQKGMALKALRQTFEGTAVLYAVAGGSETVFAEKAALLAGAVAAGICLKAAGSKFRRACENHADRLSGELTQDPMALSSVLEKVNAPDSAEKKPRSIFAGIKDTKIGAAYRKAKDCVNENYPTDEERIVRLKKMAVEFGKKRSPLPA
ncbi:MAG: M48 family metalloprotease [Alphaproteobacteria bacterium]|nr:M48 family metalloprotease [Alphaproteobacteria bacterium]